MKTSHRNGFTLVEMLVVIAIIGIIVAMTAGAVLKSQSDSRTIVCQTRLKNIGYAIKMSRNNKKLRLTTSAPVVRESMDDPDDPTTKTWAEFLIPYIDEEVEVFHCPTDAEKAALGDRIAEFPSYGINNRYHRLGSGDGTRIALLDYRETVALVSGNDPQDFTIGADPESSDSWQDYIPVERHAGYANVLTYGGDVQSLLFEDIDPLDCETHYRLWQAYADEPAGRDCDVENGDDVGS